MLWAEPADVSRTVDGVLEACEADRAFRSLTVHARDRRLSAPLLPRPPDGPVLAVAVSGWIPCLDRRAAFQIDLAGLAVPRWSGYLVTESKLCGGSSPVDGGVSSWTLFRQPDWLSHTEWLARWHGSYAQVCRDLLAARGALRDTVVRPVAGRGPVLRGVLEAHWPGAAALRDPRARYADTAAGPQTAHDRLDRARAALADPHGVEGWAFTLHVVR